MGVDGFHDTFDEETPGLVYEEINNSHPRSCPHGVGNRGDLGLKVDPRGDIPCGAQDLRNGTMKNLWLPYRGEFGHKVLWWAPSVYADKGPKVVCCEEGEEALFPGAEEYLIVPRNQDSKRREYVHYDQAFLDQLKDSLPPRFQGYNIVVPSKSYPKEYFTPKPLKQYGIVCDLVVCPRRRSYGQRKNWDHWPSLISRLVGRGFVVFAAGAPDSSMDVEIPKAWDYPRFLDATLEAMGSAELCISTDNGLAHLAVACGRPLLLISSQGRTCPGHSGIRMRRYRSENHTGSPIEVIDAWDDPGKVEDFVCSWFEEAE